MTTSFTIDQKDKCIHTHTLLRLAIEARVVTDHDEWCFLLSVGPMETVDSAALEPNLTLIQKYLSMEDISYTPPKDRLNARRAGKNFRVCDGHLFLRTKCSSRIVAMKADRTTILCFIHDISGHLDAHTTLKFAQERLWWTRMVADVYEYVRSCDACQRMQKLQKYVKILGSQLGGLLSPISNYFAGPLQR